MGFALTVTTRYEKELRVESSFSTAPAPSRFSPRNLMITGLSNRTPDKLKAWCFFSWHSIEAPFKIQVPNNMGEIRCLLHPDSNELGESKPGRARHSTSGNLHIKTSVKRESREVFICQQTEFFRDIRWYLAYVEREKIMRGCGQSVQGINIVSSVFSAWLVVSWKENSWLGKLDLGLVSAGSNGIEP